MNKIWLLSPLFVCLILLIVWPPELQKIVPVFRTGNEKLDPDELHRVVSALLAHLMAKHGLEVVESDIEEICQILFGLTLDELIESGDERRRLRILAMEQILYEGMESVAAAQISSPTFRPEVFIHYLEDVSEESIQEMIEAIEFETPEETRANIISNYRGRGFFDAERLVLMRHLYPEIEVRDGIDPFRFHSDYHLIEHTLENEEDWFAELSDDEQKVIEDWLAIVREKVSDLQLTHE